MASIKFRCRDCGEMTKTGRVLKATTVQKLGGEDIGPDYHSQGDDDCPGAFKPADIVWDEPFGIGLHVTSLCINGSENILHDVGELAFSNASLSVDLSQADLASRSEPNAEIKATTQAWRAAREAELTPEQLATVPADCPMADPASGCASRSVFGPSSCYPCRLRPELVNSPNPQSFLSNYRAPEEMQRTCLKCGARILTVLGPCPTCAEPFRGAGIIEPVKPIDHPWNEVRTGYSVCEQCGAERIEEDSCIGYHVKLIADGRHHWSTTAPQCLLNVYAGPSLDGPANWFNRDVVARWHLRELGHDIPLQPRPEPVSSAGTDVPADVADPQLGQEPGELARAAEAMLHEVLPEAPNIDQLVDELGPDFQVPELGQDGTPDELDHVVKRWHAIRDRMGAHTSAFLSEQERLAEAIYQEFRAGGQKELADVVDDFIRRTRLELSGTECAETELGQEGE